MFNGQLSYLMKAMGTATVESLPELVALVPSCGPLLSMILSKFLSVTTEYGEEKKYADIQEQIETIAQLIKDKEITPEYFREAIQKEIKDNLKKSSPRLSAYMSGIILYPYQEDAFKPEDKALLDEVFSNNSTYDDYDMDCVEHIHNFCLNYNAGIMMKGEDYHIDKDCLIVVFSTDLESPIRDDMEVLFFIQSINQLLGKKLFIEYSIF